MVFQPLSGVKVIDWTEGVAGPYASQILGDLGADVIKVERPQGDWGRTLGTQGNAQFIALNRNKRALCLDIKQKEGLEIAWSLIEQADMLITSYRPNVMERLGLSFQQVKMRNPDIIYGRISGYGYNGSLAKEPGSDTVLQAVSGFMSQIGEPDGEPFRVGIPIVDLVAARDLLVGLLGAFVLRQRGEQLTYPIDVSLFASFAALQAQPWQEFIESGESPQRTGNKNPSLSPAALFKAADNRYFSLVVLREEHWHRLCQALDKTEWLDDPKYQSNLDRIKHREELESMLSSLFSTKPREYWLDLLRQFDVLCSPVLELEEIAANAQLMEAIPHIEIPTGKEVTEKTKSIAYLPFGEETRKARYAPPAKGEHSKEILKEIGFNDEQITYFFEKNIVY